MTRKNVKMESRCQMAAVLAGPGKLKPNCATRKGPQTASGAGKLSCAPERTQGPKVPGNCEKRGRGEGVEPRPALPTLTPENHMDSLPRMEAGCSPSAETVVETQG